MCYCFSCFAVRNCGYNLGCGLRERERERERETYGMNNLRDRVKFVFSPDVIPCG